MRPNAMLLCLTVIGSLFLPINIGRAAGQPIVVLVAPFENLSGVQAMTTYEVATGNDPDRPKRSFQIDRYTEAPRAILEDILLKFDGVKVVERQRVDSLLLESEFGRLSGLVDQEKAAKLGKMLGAKFIIMGTILDVRAQKKSFSGYGVATQNTQVSCGVRVRVMDIASGSVTISKIVRGSESFMTSQFGGTSDSDVAYSVIEAALNQLKEDDEFKTAIEQAGGKAESGSAAKGSIEIEFNPKPSNCDIEIDGKYVGGSPLKRTFAQGKKMKVRITKDGFTTWERTIVVEPDLHVTPELQPTK
jgi:hypothetical protein